MGGSGSSSAVHQAQMLSDELILRAASSTGLANALALMCLRIACCMFFLICVFIWDTPPPSPHLKRGSPAAFSLPVILVMIVAVAFVVAD